MCKRGKNRAQLLFMYQFVSLLTIIVVCVWPPPASCQLVCLYLRLAAAITNNVHLFIWWFFAGRKFKWRFVLPETSQLEINAHSTTTPTAPLHRIWPIFPFKTATANASPLLPPSSLWTIISLCGLDYLEDFTWWQELFGKQWWLSARMRPHFSFFF